MLNYVFVLACGLTVILYRIYRKLLSKRHAEMREGGLKIGIDVDGVLADQIDGVLPIIKRKYGIQLKYSDIAHWRLPIDRTTIADEIEDAQRFESYISNMPVHEGARQQLRELVKQNKIFIVTARHAECDPWTIEWLLTNRICYDQYINSCKTSKDQHSLEVLMDDYVKNIKDFLTGTDGYGILFNRPWNQERTELKQWRKTGRLIIVKSWDEVGEAIVRIKRRRKENLKEN